MSPRMSGPMRTDRLRRVARCIEDEKADCLGTQSARKRAARRNLDTGGSIAQLLKAEQWLSAAHRLYFDPGAERATAPANLLIEISDGEGTAGQGPQWQ